MQDIQIRALNWSVRSGLRGPFTFGPAREDETGWTISATELRAPYRTAEMRFRRNGEEAMWEVTCDPSGKESRGR